MTLSLRLRPGATRFARDRFAALAGRRIAEPQTLARPRRFPGLRLRAEHSRKPWGLNRSRALQRTGAIGADRMTDAVYGRIFGLGFAAPFVLAPALSAVAQSIQ